MTDDSKSTLTGHLLRAVAAWCWLTSGVQAEPATLLQRSVVGDAPSGAMKRLDARRTGRSTQPLPPAAPRLLWRGHIPGGVMFAPVTDGSGRLVAATTSGYLVQLDARGRLEWTLQLPAAAAGSPAIAPGGTRWVLTATGELLAVGERGAVRIQTQLGTAHPDQVALLLPHPEGLLVVAQGRELLHVEPDGGVRVRMLLPQRIATTLARPGEVLCVTLRGELFDCTGRDAPRRLTRLAGLVGSPAWLADGRLLWSDGRRVTATSLQTQRSEHWAELEQRELVGPVTLLQPNAAAIGAKPDGVVRLSAEGELRRSSVGGAGEAAGPSLPPLGDRAGRLAFVSHDGALQLVDESGAVRTHPALRCVDPVGLTPLGPGRLALTCASGQVLAVGSAEPAASPAEPASPSEPGQ